MHMLEESRGKTGWTAQFASSSAESDVVRLANEYLATWLPSDLEYLPVECRLSHVASAEDVAYAAVVFTQCERFAPPPPEVIAPQAAAAAPASAGAPALALDDTEEAIRSARDLYNAGERLQAAGVLRLAIESHPERVAPWLPLFDLLLRERLVTEFAELARGFRALHGASPAWKTVQRAGQQIDPGNSLYGADSGAAHEAAA